MVAINGREVTSYLIDKNYIENLGWLRDALFQIVCEEIGIETTPQTMIHFNEAFLLYLTMNRPTKLETLSYGKIHELFLMFNESRYSVDKFDVFIEWNQELPKNLVQHFLEIVSPRFTDVLTALYEDFKATYEEDECPYCQYYEMIFGTIVTLVENFTLRAPFSMNLIKELMIFCMKNSRIVNLSDTEKEDFFNGHE